MTKINHLIAISVLCGLTGGCGGGSNPPRAEQPIVDPPPTNRSVDAGKVRLNAGLSCDEFRSYVASAIGDSYFEGIYGPVDWFGLPVALDIEAIDEPTVSGTNNQEANVDEADIIKTDSQGLIYTAQQNKVSILNGYPADQLDLIAEINFDQNFAIKELILDELSDRLVVISYPSHDIPSITPPIDDLLPPEFTTTGTQIKFFDVSDPTSPIELKELILTGFIDQTRLVNGQLLVLLREEVLTSPQWFEYFDNNTEFTQLISEYFEAVTSQNEDLAEQLELQARDMITNIVMQFDAEEFLPSVSQSVDGISTPIDAINCEDIYASELSVRLGINSIYRLSLDGDYLEGLAAIISPSSAAYISENNIYMYQLSAGWWWQPDQLDETAIHQVTYSENLLDYVGTGVVAGSIHNQFSLGEYDNYLRVATSQTLIDSNSGTISNTNHMSILQADDQGKLSIVGSTENYAPDETIFSARFVEDRAYVVTFRQVDPLFTFDLSVPTAPKILGELEIPGFSEYIHPVGSDRLVTIGRNGTEDGLLPGVRFQLFDVSNLNDPVLLHSYVPTDNTGEIQYAWSLASYEHRAFTYVDQHDLLVVPFTISNYDSISENFSGFLAVNVNDANGFTELGRIDHEDLLPPDHCSTAATSLEDNCVILGDYSWVTPLRSIVISDSETTVIYSLSNIGIKANSLNNVAVPVSSVTF